MVTNIKCVLATNELIKLFLEELLKCDVSRLLSRARTLDLHLLPVLAHISSVTSIDLYAFSAL